MSAHNPLDEALGGDELNGNPEVSKTDSLAQYMATLGFMPKKPLDKDTLEYARTYTDPSGRVGRAVAVIKKDAVGLEPVEMSYLSVTIQISIKGTAEEIRARAPAFCKTDALRIEAFFTPASSRTEADVIECGFCGEHTAEHQLVEGKKACPDCAKRKGI